MNAIGRIIGGLIAVGALVLVGLFFVFAALWIVGLIGQQLR